MISLLIQSIDLDLKTFATRHLKLFQKFTLICKKYIYFVKRIFKKGNENKGSFLGKEFHFPNKYGYVGIQRIIVDASFLVDELPKNLTILDIGAHAGEFSFFAQNFLKAKKVVSIEPYSKVFNILEKNNKHTYRYAVTDKKKATLNISKISTQLNSLNKDKTRDQVDIENVPVISLAEFLKKTKETFDLLKVDTEGSEMDVIKSGLTVLKKFRYILLEVELGDDYLNKFKQILEATNGFKMKTIGRYGKNNRSVDILFEKLTN